MLDPYVKGEIIETVYLSLVAARQKNKHAMVHDIYAKLTTVCDSYKEFLGVLEELETCEYIKLISEQAGGVFNIGPKFGQWRDAMTTQQNTGNVNNTFNIGQVGGSILQGNTITISQGDADALVKLLKILIDTKTPPSKDLLGKLHAVMNAGMTGIELIKAITSLII